jgi:predicted ATPase/DNA-binding SARP family transcriptional activator
VQIAALGPLEVRADSGELVEIGGARLRTLLILLALEPGRVVTTSRLVDALWGEQVPAGAGNALQALVSRLRRAVPGIVVTPRPAGYQLEIDPDTVDVRRFERLAAGGRSQLGADPAGALATLREALALWRGPALADVAGERFAQATIAWLDELRLTALQDRVEAELRLGPSAALAAELEALVTTHPLHEPLVGQLMRVQYALGRRGAALVSYERARTRLADQLGTDPSPELVALHTELLRANHRPAAKDRPATTQPPPDQPPVTAPPDQAAPAAAELTNLRAELTSFVGRDEELSEVGRLLDRSRLTTLTGPGGAGKTRLAVEAARTQLTTMPDGVWLIELAPVTDPGEVAQTVLATLGLRDQALLATRPRRPVAEEPIEPLGRLVAALSDKQALLVLDNCEHLVSAAATLADRVLRTCARVRIVATSREPLGIDGENLWPVQPLALPPPDADADTARRYAAVRLLADRAGAVCPGFAVTAANVTALVRVCRALDGMPLAIELAAARFRAMAPEQVAARLDDRFRLLTGGSRTALPRHQTLRAVVDWSWELLDDAERALCRRLSVFAGGATLESAEQVCAGGPVAPAGILDLLTALVDKSLLVARHDPGGTRYRMLETIRAYGQERLAEAGELDATRAAHAAYLLGLAEAAADQLHRVDQLTWLDRLAAEHDNLHTAMRWAIATGDALTAVRLVAAVGWYWWLRGYKVEGAELSQGALALTGEVPDEIRAVALTMSALLTIDGTHHTPWATACFQEAAELAARLPAPIPPLLRLVLPMFALFTVVEASRRPMATNAIEAALADPDPWIAATARVVRAHLELNFGRQHTQAELDFRQALAGYRQLGDRWGTAFALSSLAALLSWRGEFGAAADQLDEGLRLLAELDVAEDAVQYRVRLAQLRWLLGDRDAARTEMARARRDARRVGLPEVSCWVACAQAELARLDGDLDLAGLRLAEAVEAGRHPFVGQQARALVASAEGLLAAARGDLAAAAGHHVRALRTALESVDSPVIAQTLVGLADLELRRGDPPRAARLLGAGVAVRGTRDLSLVDEVRLTEALADRYPEDYRRGLGTTIETVAELVGELRPGDGTRVPPAARTPR